MAALDGADPVDQLRAAAAGGELDTAADPAAVLSWRIDPAGSTGGPLPWLPAVPYLVSQDEQWGPYLQACTARVQGLAGDVADQTAAYSADTAPPWARALTAAGREVAADATALFTAAAAEQDLPDDQPAAGRRAAGKGRRATLP